MELYAAYCIMNYFYPKVLQQYIEICMHSTHTDLQQRRDNFFKGQIINILDLVDQEDILYLITI